MADSGISFTDLIARPFGSIPALIATHASERPDAKALIVGDNSLTCSQLNAEVDRMAAALQNEGMAAQQAISICAISSANYAIAFLGGLRAGIAVAPLAPGSTPESLAMMVENCEARFLFLDASTMKEFAPVRDRLKAEIICLDDSAGGRAFSSFLAPSGAKPKPVAIDPDWAFNIIYSSGTTGAPKGIVQPHSMRWSHVQRGANFGYGRDAVTICSTPLYSNTTLVSFFPTLGLGGTVVLLPKFGARTFLQLAEKHRATHAMLVPVQYRRIMQDAEFDRFNLSALKAKFCTSAPFAADLKADILKRWPGKLVEYYGMTEGGGTCILVADENPTKLHTVGRPAPGHDIRLIDEQGRSVPQGEVGEIVGRSETIMKGYHREPGKTREAEWYDDAGNRFIRTGDMGRFDADGFLTLMDRRKDMIISGGFNIYPSDIEAVLVQHPDVAEAAVVGIASERWGETPVAFVVARPGRQIDPSALMAWTNAKVGKTQRLAALELLDALPRSHIGKVLKRDLRDSYKPEKPL